MPTTSRWEFDESVSAVFDDMLRRSIPQYEVMRRAVFDIGKVFVQPGTDIVDLGASHGEAMAPFVKEYARVCRCIGIEVSKPMMEQLATRFAPYVDAGRVKLLEDDLRIVYPGGIHASLTLAVLTLQFIPIELRERVIRSAYRSTVAGGALVVVEKVIGRGAELNDLLGRVYENHKRDSGYSRDEIERKRLSLQGVLVPVTARWNEDLLRSSGFRTVECIWRWMNFAAWVAIKDRD